MEPINKVIEDVKHRFEKIGLYMVDVNVATTDADAVGHNLGEDEGELKEDFRKKMADGEAMWIMNGVFTIGAQAFEDRVLNPEADKENTDFLIAVPSEIELIREKMIREGLSAFEPDEDET